MRSLSACWLVGMMTLVGCGDSGGDNGEPASPAGGGSDAGGSDAGGSDAGGSDAGGSGASAGSSSGGTGSPTAGASSSADIAACEAATVDFADPVGAESVQWAMDGAKKAATPPPGGAYFFNGFLNLTTYAADLSGSISVGVNKQQESFAAGSYGCEEGASVTVNNLGIANSTMMGADCAVTYDEDVEDGGRLKGTFWAFVPATEWPFKFAGGCVHGRFDVTDAPDAD